MCLCVTTFELHAEHSMLFIHGVQRSLHVIILGTQMLLDEESVTFGNNNEKIIMDQSEPLTLYVN